MLHPVGRLAASRLEPAWPSELARRREPASAILQPEACRDALRAAVRPDGPVAVRLALGSQSAREMLSVRAWSPAPARPDAQGALLSEQAVLPLARDGPKEPLREAEGASGSGARQAAAREACAAAELRRGAAWERGVRQVEHAVAEPQPAVAQAASERQAAEVAAAEPDGPQVEAAVAAEPDEPRVGAAAALPGAPARQPAEVQRAAERPVVRAPQAVRPLVPSVAASLFRQPLAGPGLQRAAA